jgi:cbb3-type cytochrome oxidase subunit 3
MSCVFENFNVVSLDVIINTYPFIICNFLRIYKIPYCQYKNITYTPTGITEEKIKYVCQCQNYFFELNLLYYIYQANKCLLFKGKIRNEVFSSSQKKIILEISTQGDLENVNINQQQNTQTEIELINIDDPSVQNSMQQIYLQTLIGVMKAFEDRGIPKGISFKDPDLEEKIFNLSGYQKVSYEENNIDGNIDFEEESRKREEEKRLRELEAKKKQEAAENENIKVYQTGTEIAGMIPQNDYTKSYILDVDVDDYGYEMSQEEKDEMNNYANDYVKRYTEKPSVDDFVAPSSEEQEFLDDPGAKVDEIVDEIGYSYKSGHTVIDKDGEDKFSTSSVKLMETSFNKIIHEDLEMILGNMLLTSQIIYLKLDEVDAARYDININQESIQKLLVEKISDNLLDKFFDNMFLKLNKHTCKPNTYPETTTTTIFSKETKSIFLRILFAIVFLFILVLIILTIYQRRKKAQAQAQAQAQQKQRQRQQQRQRQNQNVNY